MTPTKRFRMNVLRRAGESKGEWAERNRQWQYEEAVVKHVIRRLELPDDLGVELWKEHKQTDWEGFGRLTLPAFCQKIKFPVWLGSRRFNAERQLPLARFLREFGFTHMCEALVDISKTAPDHYKWFGLVFPVPGAKFMALHTRESELKPGVTRVVIPQSHHGAVLLEPLSRLLDAVGPPYSWQT